VFSATFLIGWIITTAIKRLNGGENIMADFSYAIQELTIWFVGIILFVAYLEFKVLKKRNGDDE